MNPQLSLTTNNAHDFEQQTAQRAKRKAHWSQLLLDDCPFIIPATAILFGMAFLLAIDGFASNSFPNFLGSTMFVGCVGFVFYLIVQTRRLSK